MFSAHTAALLSTVAFLGVTIYFVLGSIPLLILKHNTHVDGRFVRNFFNVYYIAATITASLAALSQAFAGRSAHAVGAACLAVLALVLRHYFLGRMDALRSNITGSNPQAESQAIAAFRKTHLTAIGVNMAQLLFLLYSLVSLSLQMKAAA